MFSHTYIYIQLGVHRILIPPIRAPHCVLGKYKCKIASMYNMSSVVSTEGSLIQMYMLNTIVLYICKERGSVCDYVYTSAYENYPYSTYKIFKYLMMWGVVFYNFLYIFVYVAADCACAYENNHISK